MSGDDIANVAYLIILGGSIGGWVLVESRGRMGQTMRMLLAWALIFIGLAAGYGLFQDLNLSGQRSAVSQSGERLELSRAPDQHFYLTLGVDGQKIRFMVDTGASNIVLSNRDAARLGIDPAGLAYIAQARTANGTIGIARVTLKDVTLEGERMGDLPAWVGEGILDVSLLGMDFLNLFSKVEMSRERLVLIR